VYCFRKGQWFSSGGRKVQQIILTFLGTDPVELEGGTWFQVNNSSAVDGPLSWSSEVAV